MLMEDTVISSGVLKFNTRFVDEDAHIQDDLIEIIHLLKVYADSLMDEEEYADLLDFRIGGAYENGGLVSIKDDDILKWVIRIEERVPYYLHAHDESFIGVLINLNSTLSSNPGMFSKELDGVVLEKYGRIMTRESDEPTIHALKLYVTFVYNELTDTFYLDFEEVYNYELEPSTEEISCTSDIFSFNLRDVREFKPFIGLLAMVLDYPETYTDVFESDVEKEIGDLIVRPTIYDKRDEEKGKAIITHEDLLLLFKEHSDNEYYFGPASAFAVYRKLVPIIANNIMTLGRIH